MKRFILIISVLIINTTLFAQQKILFDNTKNEMASNADWVIDTGNDQFPSPDQSGISGDPLPNPTGDVDDYWSGALSMWGIEMVKQGFIVETLPSSGSITYGDSNNSQDLSNYDVFVVCEPNNLFSSSEKTAMMDFVQNGGGLFIIADHAGADRDGDGYDALDIWNDFITNNPVQNNAFGFTFDVGSDIDAIPTTNIANDSSDPLLHGIAGDVDAIESHGGATMTINTSDNSSVKAIVFEEGYSNTGTTNVLVAYSTYGSGRVVVINDSSLAEDDTSNDGTTYPGWIQPIDSGGANDKDNGRLITNATIWLANTTIYPEPTNNVTDFSVTATTDNSITLSWADATGTQLPNAYLIKAVENSNPITDPVDGTQESNSTLVKNVSYGLETVTFTGLTHSTTYNFKIYPYTNSGSNIDYLISSTPEVQGTTLVGADVINSEDFSDCSNSTWFTYDVAGSTDVWNCTSGYQDINGYGDEADEDWLIISSPINFDNYTSEEFTFKTQESYEGPDLELYYSSDYSGSGSPSNANWTLISHTFNDVSTNSTFSDWYDDLIDLSSLSGNLYLAFKYTATGAGGESEYWRIDDLLIKGYIITTPVATITTTPGCNDSGSVTVSSDLNGTQTFYLKDDGGSTLEEWTGDANSHEFTGLSDGTYKGQVKKDSETSELTDATTLTNIPDPVAPSSITASETTICNGDLTTLSYSGGSGDTFTWHEESCLGSTVGTGNNISVNPTSTTTYYGSWENTCGTSSCESITISITPDIEIVTQPEGLTECENENVTFSISANNATNYQWKKNGVNISGANSNTYTISGISINDEGDYTCEVTNSCGNITSDIATLVVNSLPTIITQVQNIDAIVGEDISFDIDAENATDYQWYFNNNTISGANQPSYSITNVQSSDAGNYYVEISNTCGNITSNEAILSVSASINELAEYGIKVYPNPSNGKLNIEFPQRLSDIKVSISNISGKIIYYNNLTTSNQEIDLSSFSKGVYFINLRFNNKIIISKLILK